MKQGTKIQEFEADGVKLKGTFSENTVIKVLLIVKVARILKYAGGALAGGEGH